MNIDQKAYAIGNLGHSNNGVTVKSVEELDSMWAAGQIVGQTLQHLRTIIEPGMRTIELDAIAEQKIRHQGALPAFKGYRGFPGTLCVSINEQVVHGIPGNKIVRDGDIVSLDLGAIVDGFFGDSAITVPVGEVPAHVKKLLQVCEASLWAGIGQIMPGNRLGDISAAVEKAIEGSGKYGLVRDYGGHGIGRALHEEPFIPNFGRPGRGMPLQSGMVLAIEPMVNLGGDNTRVLDDHWTVVTADGALSAHFEHTVAVTSDGPKVMTAVSDIQSSNEAIDGK